MQASQVDIDLIGAKSLLTTVASLNGLVTAAEFALGEEGLFSKVFGFEKAAALTIIQEYKTYSGLVDIDISNLANAGSLGRLKAAATKASSDINSAIVDCSGLAATLKGLNSTVFTFIANKIINLINKLGNQSWLSTIQSDGDKLNGLYNAWFAALEAYTHAMDKYEAALKALAACEACRARSPLRQSRTTTAGARKHTLPAVAVMSVQGQCTTPQSVENSIQGTFGGGTGSTIIFAGGGGEFVPPPVVQSGCNCNPSIGAAEDAASKANSTMHDPPIDTAPAVAGTDVAAGAVGQSGAESPMTFIGMAPSNLGLISGSTGNSGNTPASSPRQMVATIATFDQVELDLEGFFALASSPGGSLGIAGDVNLLEDVDARLKAVTTAENLLFGGDANWLNTDESSTLEQWMSAFFADAQASSADGGTITPDQAAQLLAMTLPTSVTTAEAGEFIDRWNRTVQYWGQGIFTSAEVPAGQSTDFLDLSALQSAFDAAAVAEQVSQANGYVDVGVEMEAALTQVVSDLQGQGVCATIKLQIDQTATLTRSAFSGTLTLTNGEDDGA